MHEDHTLPSIIFNDFPSKDEALMSSSSSPKIFPTHEDSLVQEDDDTSNASNSLFLKDEPLVKKSLIHPCQDNPCFQSYK